MQDMYSFLRKLLFLCDYTIGFSAFDGVINEIFSPTENLLFGMRKSIIFSV